MQKLPAGTLSIADLHTTYNFTPGKSSMRVGADYLMAKLSLYVKDDDYAGAKPFVQHVRLFQKKRR